MNVPSDTDIVVLVHRAQRQELTALQRIYDYFAPMVYRYGLLRCGDQYVAEEVVGDVFECVVQAIDRFHLPATRQRAACMGWLLQIADEALGADAMTRGAASPSTPAGVSAQPTGVSPPLTQFQSDLAPALRQLPVPQQKVLILRLVERLSSEDVAVMTGTTRSAVMLVQRQALTALAAYTDDARQ